LFGAAASMLINWRRSLTECIPMQSMGTRREREGNEKETKREREGNEKGTRREKISKTEYQNLT